MGLLFVFLAFASFTIAQDEDEASGEAVTFFNQGQDAHEKGDLPAAIKLYEKALAAIPDFPEAELQRGNALLSLGRIDDAEKSFRHTVALREDWTLALANLGSILVQKNLLPEAEKVLTKAISLDELNYPAYSALVELRLKTKSKPEVLQTLLTKMKALTVNAAPPASIWAVRAALESSLGDKKSAKISAEKALQIDPKNIFALSELADAALNQSDTTAADEIVKSLEAITPGSVNVKALRARVLLAGGKPEDAIKILNAIQNPPAEILSLRDKILAGSSVNSVELEKQLEKDPANLAVLGRLCTVLRIEAPAKALDYCRKAFEGEPGNINHAIGYGAALVQAKLYVEAIAVFRKLLAFAPDNSTVHANLATALFQMKRFPEAKVEYLWLIEKQPNLAAAYYLLGITHDRMGEYLDAMANYQHFMRLADADKNKLDIEKVNLRLPDLQKQIKDGKGKRNE